MEDFNKKLIYDILTNKFLSNKEKFNKAKNIFPNYLINPLEKKAIFEKIEGIFHDGLGTYFENIVYENLNEFYSLGQPKISKQNSIDKMENGKELYELFFPDNQYEINYNLEIKNIESGSSLAVEYIKDIILDRKILKLIPSSQDYRFGNARDLYLELEDGNNVNFSLKTDKSGKIAISEGQTSLIFEKVFNRYFGLTTSEYEIIKTKLFGSIEENKIKENFDNIAGIFQTVMIDKLGIKDAQINNMKNGKITNKNALVYLISQLKFYKISEDGSNIIAINRLTGKMIRSTILDDIDIKNIDVDDFSCLPGNAKKYKYGTEPGIKFKGKKFVSFQIKHKRGKKPSKKFSDITIRLTTK